MTRRILSQIFAAIIWVVSASTAYAGSANTLERIQQRGQLILGTSGNMPMMSQLTDNGGLSGLDIDIARYIAQAMKVELLPKVMPSGV